MNGRRLTGVGVLCAVLAWGCERREAAPEVARRPVMQAPDMAAPMGERTAAQAETFRRSVTDGDPAQPSPAEVPGGRELRGQPPARQQPTAGQQPTAQQQPAQQQPAQQQPAQQQPARQQPAQQEREHTVLMPGAHMDEQAMRAAEDAATQPRVDAQAGDERVVVANVEFDGRLQQVSEGGVAVQDREGNLYEAELEEGSRVLRKGRAISARQLQQGAEVRASLDLVGEGFVVRELEQLPRGRR